MHEPRAEPETFWIEPLGGEADLDGVLDVEGESFTNPWTRAMYAWELQNRAVCHIYVARTADCPVAGFCALWLVFDEIHINNVAVRPRYRGRGMGTAILRHVLTEAHRLGEHVGSSRRASTAGMGSSKKNHKWAPNPERDRSSAT